MKIRLVWGKLNDGRVKEANLEASPDHLGPEGQLSGWKLQTQQLSFLI